MLGADIPLLLDALLRKPARPSPQVLNTLSYAMQWPVGSVPLSEPQYQPTMRSIGVYPGCFLDSIRTAAVGYTSLSPPFSSTAKFHPPPKLDFSTICSTSEKRPPIPESCPVLS